MSPASCESPTYLCMWKVLGVNLPRHLGGYLCDWDWQVNWEKMPEACISAPPSFDRTLSSSRLLNKYSVVQHIPATIFYRTMSKRKRDTDELNDGDSSGLSKKSLKDHRVQHKFAQGCVKLGHAFKIAKGFERQKLGRRKKQIAANKGVEAVKRIDDEVLALKVRSPGHTSRVLLCALTELDWKTGA